MRTKATGSRSQVEGTEKFTVLVSATVAFSAGCLLMGEANTLLCSLYRAFVEAWQALPQ